MPSVDISSQTGKDFAGDALIVPVFSGRERHRLPLAISKVARQVMDEEDFKADYLEVVPLHHPNGVKESRWMVLVGLGGYIYCLKKKWKKIGILSPSTSTIDHDAVQVAVTEGALLANYDFVSFKGGKPEAKQFSSIEIFTNGDDTRKARRKLPAVEAGVAACHRVRDLANTPAGDLYPEVFADMAVKLAKQHKLWPSARAASSPRGSSSWSTSPRRSRRNTWCSWGRGSASIPAASPSRTPRAWRP